MVGRVGRSRPSLVLRANKITCYAFWFTNAKEKLGRRYFGGELDVSEHHQAEMIAVWGDVGSDVIAACAAERADYIAGVSHSHWRVEYRHDYVGPDDDTELYSYADWVEKFGLPGGSTDVHGRVCGVFPSEPCFCE